LGTPKLPIIGGKDCEAVTKTPGNGEGFKIGSIAVKGLYTPCHTQDSICWYMEDGGDKVVFTGDTLFHGGTFASKPEVDLSETILTQYRLRKVLRGHGSRDAQGSE
jgi:glyoxylase-like metal-dependent hydrolase (beta-lactamase superfamily II)